ncbi:hypothetical protein NMY22_g20306 [Coprinellus aureogranulatus]|nr:hypothetical protein NMY22_g20306 [Coprinellus aureogranulatus]
MAPLTVHTPTAHQTPSQQNGGPSPRKSGPLIVSRNGQDPFVIVPHHSPRRWCARHHHRISSRHHNQK